MVSTTLLIFVIMGLYGVGCIMIAAWPGFFTVEPFATAIGVVALLGSNVFSMLAMFLMVTW